MANEQPDAIVLSSRRLFEGVVFLYDENNSSYESARR